MPYDTTPLVFADGELPFQERSRRHSQEALRREKQIAHRAFTVLWKHYPNHFWRTRVDKIVDPRTGRVGYMLMIQLALMMDETRWYTIPDEKLSNENEFEARCKEAGGHILERFGFDRGIRDLDQWLGGRVSHRLWNRRQEMPV